VKIAAGADFQPKPIAAASSTPEQSFWLFSRRADFWFGCSGASLGLLAAVLLIFFHGDREIDALDFVLSEFHLGATYDAIIRRRLWRHRHNDVLLIPLAILVLTYALSMSGQAILLTSITMYAAVWHRGRQSLGVARFYQRAMGGPLSPAHDRLFRGAVYLPMLAATLAYSHLAPAEYDEKPYLALNLGSEITSIVGLAAVLWVIAYIALTLRQSNGQVHPGERWIVLAHAVAFGSGYVLGASNASFLLVLAVHHEVQYLYFTYAMARRTTTLQTVSKRDRAIKDVHSQFSRDDPLPLTEAKFAASFLLWPVIGFVGAMIGAWAEIGWLEPLGASGLYCHYWLDGRIWTRRSIHD